MRLETKRLVLRLPQTEDAKNITEGLSPLEVRRYLAGVPNPYNLKEAKKFIKNSKGKHNFMIELRENKKVIGGMGFGNFNDSIKEASIGYWLNKEYWKQGIMSEAVKEMLGFAFKNLKLKRVVLTCNEKNEGSKAIARKFGFKYKGTLRKAHCPLVTGKIADKLSYGLLKEEWEIMRRRLK